MKGEERVTTKTFMAAREEDRGQVRFTLFPPDVRIRLLDEPHSWEPGESGTLYVTFSPSQTSEITEYKIAMEELQRSTRLVMPAAV